jgi:hypothetical protein
MTKTTAAATTRTTTQNNKNNRNNNHFRISEGISLKYDISKNAVFWDVIPSGSC